MPERQHNAACMLPRGCWRGAPRWRQLPAHLCKELIAHFNAEAVVKQGAQQSAVVHKRLEGIVLQALGQNQGWEGRDTAGWQRGRWLRQKVPPPMPWCFVGRDRACIRTLRSSRTCLTARKHAAT